MGEFFFGRDFWIEFDAGGLTQSDLWATSIYQPLAFYLAEKMVARRETERWGLALNGFLNKVNFLLKKELCFFRTSCKTKIIPIF